MGKDPKGRIGGSMKSPMDSFTPENVVENLRHTPVLAGMRHINAKKKRRLISLALLAGSTLTWAAEVPRRADEFIDAIGINGHIDVDASIYNEAVIGELGIRHLRSNVNPSMTTLQRRLASLYANYGLRVNKVCDTTSFTPTQIRDLAKAAQFESVEGLNEPDAAGPRSYAALTDNIALSSYPATLKYQQDLFAAMGADSATLGKDVLSPAMADPANSVFLLGVAADYVAMHTYPAQQMPTGNFLTSYAIPNAQFMAGDTPMRLIATETGYRSGSAGGDISLAAATKYIPRLYAEYFRLGVARSYLFELNDVSIYDYGILDANFVPKQPYYQIQNLLSLIHEASWDTSTKTWTTPATFYPASVDYTLSTASPNVHHVLLQKSDGRIYLLLWQEVSSYDLAKGRDISNSTVPVDLTFNLGIATASLYRLSSTGPQATYSNVATLRVNVPDELLILELTPGVSTSAAASRSGQVVSIATTVANTSFATGQQGQLVVSRSGSTASELNVAYTTSGTAVSGADYDALPGSVTIPAGATSATIAVNPRNAAIVGRKSLVLSLATSDAYGVAATRSASVFFGSTQTVLADFSSGISGWLGSLSCLLNWTDTQVDTGAGAMQIQFVVDGVHRWTNNFHIDFPTPQDWTTVTKLVLRVAEDAGNPAGDLGKAVYFAWCNDGVDVANGYGTGRFPLTLDPVYHTVTLDLGDYPRNEVTSLSFYMDGAMVPVGTHTLYVGSITALSDTNGVLEDFEEFRVSNWSVAAQSAVKVETNSVDTGVQALRWTYTGTGLRWDNCIRLNFPLPADLSKYSTLRFRFKEEGGNPASDVGAPVYLDWYNNGVRANGARGVTSFPLQSPEGYRTIEVNISAFKRDSISTMFFYVDGAYLATGVHTWYLDNITVY